jgi:hypothetical protein
MKTRLILDEKTPLDSGKLFALLNVAIPSKINVELLSLLCSHIRGALGQADNTGSQTTAKRLVVVLARPNIAAVLYQHCRIVQAQDTHWALASRQR